MSTKNILLILVLLIFIMNISNTHPRRTQRSITNTSTQNLFDCEFRIYRDFPLYSHEMTGNIYPLVWKDDSIQNSLFIFFRIADNKRIVPSEGIIGLSFTPYTWLLLGFGAGMNSDDAKWRLRGICDIPENSTRHFLFSLACEINPQEKANLEIWYEARVQYHILSWCNVGLFTEYTQGTGIRCDIHFVQTPFSVWFAGLGKGWWGDNWKRADKVALLGIHASF